MYYFKLIFFASVLLFIGCSDSPKPVDGSDQQFAHNAISIEYNSSKELNIYDDEPHALVLVVYELNNINSFNTLKKDGAGIVKLLGAKKFDESVMNVHKFFISPNETKKLMLDRATGTVWVAMVAGYYDMRPSASTRVYKIPDYSAWKFYKSEEKQKFLAIKLYFDKSSIEQRQE